MTTTHIITPCGLTKNRRGKRFTEESLKDHIKDCARCGGRHRRSIRRFLNKQAAAEPEVNLELTDDIGDDLPDGAYFALAHELGEL